MAELVDALVSGTSGATLGSSSLLMPTTNFGYCAHGAQLQKFSATAKCGKPHEDGQTKSFGVVAQLIERYVRIVEVVGLSPISSTTNFYYRAAQNAA